MASANSGEYFIGAGWSATGQSMLLVTICCHYALLTALVIQERCPRRRSLHNPQNFGALAWMVVLVFALGCGPKNNTGGNTNNPTYSVSVTVSGLASGTSFTITDADHSGASVVVSSNGTFSLDASLTNGASYDAMFTSPAGQSCLFSNSASSISGTIASANVILTVTCTSSSTSIALDGPAGLVFDANFANLYVANANGNQVLIYAEGTAVGSSGASTPTLTQTGSITMGINEPRGLAFDADGYLYVTNGGSDDVTVYKPSVSKSQVFATISGITDPYGVAVDQDGNVYVASNSANAILEYSGNPTSGFTLSATLSHDGASNQLLAPEALMFNGSSSNGTLNALFVGLGGSTNSVLLYGTPVSVTSNPRGNLTNNGCSTAPNAPTGIATNGLSGGGGSAGSSPTVFIYVTNNSGNGSVTSWDLTNIMTGGCPAPTATSGSQSQISQPEGVAVDASGNVFVANSGNNTITVYAPITAAPIYTQH